MDTSAGSLASIRIETHSIDVVPQAERRGHVAGQAPFWFLGNFQFFTIAIGFIGPSMGLGVGWTGLAGASGILFGTVFMALHASQGSQLGLPQMVQSRAQFGYRGVLVPLFATLVTFCGYNIVQTKLVADGLAALLGWNRPVVAVIIGLISFLLAAWGHHWLHRAFLGLFAIGIVLVGALSIGALAGLTHAAAFHAHGSAPGWSTVAFAAQFTAAAAYNLSFAPQVSDYTRYLDPRTKPASVIVSVFLGAAGSAIWLILLGAWLAARFGQSDALVALRDAGNALTPGFGSVLVIDSVASIAAVMGMGAYSGALTLVTGQNSLFGTPPSSGQRVFWVAIVAAFSTSTALILPGSAVNAVNAALTIMLYLLVPWTAINLLDYFVLSKGSTTVNELFLLEGIYGRWNRAGLGAYATGLLASIPFMVVPSVFIGPLASSIDQVDVAWLIGLVVAAGSYALYSRARIGRAESGLGSAPAGGAGKRNAG
jgi:purine-cytosine permease-like protein